MSQLISTTFRFNMAEQSPDRLYCNTTNLPCMVPTFTTQEYRAMYVGASEAARFKTTEDAVKRMVGFAYIEAAGATPDNAQLASITNAAMCLAKGICHATLDN